MDRATGAASTSPVLQSRSWVYMGVEGLGFLIPKLPNPKTLTPRSRVLGSKGRDLGFRATGWFSRLGGAAGL